MSEHRLFFDTEFIEDGETIKLLSIGVVRDDGAEYYAEANWTSTDRASDWVAANVLPHLEGGSTMRGRGEMAEALTVFAGPNPEWWAYYADYDWVVLCQIYGTMMDLPTTWPMFCMDLKQLAVTKGDQRLPNQTGTEHHALADARWVRDSYLWLQGRAT